MNGKRIAAEHAVNFIKDGMIVGIGTGSTSAFAIEAMGNRVHEGLSIKAVASSIDSEEKAKQAGISLIPLSEVKALDIYIDGADEVDKDLNLIKGGGGALLREKILAFHSKNFMVIVDSSKLVRHLGKYLLPVEVTPFAMELTMRQLQQLGCTTSVRMISEKHFITDNGNMIIDCDFRKIENVDELSHQLNNIPGVVENGLFPKTMVHKVIVGYENGELKEMNK